LLEGTLTQALLRRKTFLKRLHSIVLLQAIRKSDVGSNLVVQRDLCLSALILVNLADLGAESVTLACLLLAVLGEGVFVIFFDELTERFPTSASDRLDLSVRPGRLLRLRTGRSLRKHLLRRHLPCGL